MIPQKQTGVYTASPVPVDPPLWGAEDPGERQATVSRQPRLAAPASHRGEGIVGQHPIDTAQFRKFVNEAEI
jgi:hypothetical protein